MIDHETGTFRGDGGLDLFRQRWAPAARPPRAAIAVVHGFGEHSGRYQTLVEHLVPRGHAIHGFDLRGHGRSPGQRGHIDRWAQYREDVRLFLGSVRRRDPGLPLFLLGHSMGGLVVLEFLLHHGEDLAGVAVSAPAIDRVKVASPALVLLSKALSPVLPRFSVNVSLGSVVRDPDTLEQTRSDPLNHRRGSARWGTEALSAVARVKARSREISVPLLVIHGDADPIIAVSGSRRLAEEAPTGIRELRVYPEAFHETLNDRGREVVLQDIEEWLERRVAATGATPEPMATTA
jgi:alpha-beta hydrolase superfamily lysophospholipase